MSDDPRITRVGRILRRSCRSTGCPMERRQGDMSLIRSSPRPAREVAQWNDRGYASGCRSDRGSACGRVSGRRDTGQARSTSDSTCSSTVWCDPDRHGDPAAHGPSGPHRPQRADLRRRSQGGIELGLCSCSDDRRRAAPVPEVGRRSSTVSPTSGRGRPELARGRARHHEAVPTQVQVMAVSAPRRGSKLSHPPDLTGPRRRSRPGCPGLRRSRRCCGRGCCGRGVPSSRPLARVNSSVGVSEIRSAPTISPWCPLTYDGPVDDDPDPTSSSSREPNWRPHQPSRARQTRRSVACASGPPRLVVDPSTAGETRQTKSSVPRSGRLLTDRPHPIGAW